VKLTLAKALILAQQTSAELQETMGASARQERVLNPSTDIEIYNIVKQRVFARVSEEAAQKEESGVSWAILFQSLQPLSKTERIANIAEGIMAMSNEEAHYWFGKIAKGNRSNALKALRILLAD